MCQALERLQFDFQLSHELSVSPWITQLSRTWREYPCQVCPVYLHIGAATVFHNAAIKELTVLNTISLSTLFLLHNQA